MLVYSNVFDYLALLGFTGGFVTDEVTAHVETMANTARTVRSKKATTGAIFASPRLHVSSETPATVHTLNDGGGVRKRS